MLRRLLSRTRSAFESRTEVWREAGLGSEIDTAAPGADGAAPMTRTRRPRNPTPTGTGRATAGRATGAR